MSRPSLRRAVQSLGPYAPQIAGFGSMLLLVAAADLILHATGLSALGLYAGYLGSLLIVVSFAYSARKRKLVRWSSPRRLLTLHKAAAWLGPLLVLIHGGFHLNALLPWLALAAMVAAVASGLTGSYLLQRARAELSSKRKQLIAGGASPAQADQELYHESLAVDVMKRWRVVHMPITTVFAVLTLLHVASVLALWSW